MDKTTTRTTMRLAILAALVALPGVSAQQCYGLNGKEQDESFVPCNLDAEFSACCASNKSTPDICMESGMCAAQHPSYQGMFYMTGCTGQDGEGCPTICNDCK
jgi:hypothetical protein